MNDIIQLFENIPDLVIQKQGSTFIFKVGSEVHQHNNFMDGVRSVVNNECKKVEAQIEQTEEALLKFKARLEILSRMKQSFQSQQVNISMLD